MQPAQPRPPLLAAAASGARAPVARSGEPRAAALAAPTAKAAPVAAAAINCDPEVLDLAQGASNVLVAVRSVVAATLGAPAPLPTAPPAPLRPQGEEADRKWLSGKAYPVMNASAAGPDGATVAHGEVHSARRARGWDSLAASPNGAGRGTPGRSLLASKAGPNLRRSSRAAQNPVAARVDEDLANSGIPPPPRPFDLMPEITQAASAAPAPAAEPLAPLPPTEPLTDTLQAIVFAEGPAAVAPEAWTVLSGEDRSRQPKLIPTDLPRAAVFPFQGCQNSLVRAQARRLFHSVSWP